MWLVSLAHAALPRIADPGVLDHGSKEPVAVSTDQ